MYFENFAALIYMDGHGAFVWSAYTITLIVLISLVVMPLMKKKQFIKQQRMQLRREQGRNSIPSDTTSS